MAMGTTSDGTMNMNMNMQSGMSFEWGTNAIILYSGWPGHSPGKYIVALVLVFCMAVIVEVLSSITSIKEGTGVPPMTAALSHACVYGFRVAVSYLVMLSLMSFNVGVFIVAVIGHGVGFFYVKAKALTIKQDEDMNNNV
ncbi:copper transporter 1-like [Cannabis sativa]|uniref:Copper transport protein n=1 Tax=Cannabis sativa TaxID=3483 RepID=A0A803QGJ6_CANSA|nr:copper transporter 1-like [Cannabis sativa]